MKRQNPFKMSAMNSLRSHQVQIKDEKQLLNTFKGGNDLRKQLNKANNTKVGINNGTLKVSQKQFSKTSVGQQKPQSQALLDQMAALDNFKAPVTRQKTKNLLQNIKLRRRTKHIQAYNHFKQDLQDYKQNLLSIYQSVFNDCKQVLFIKESQINNYVGIQIDEYLLGRQKELLGELQSQLEIYLNEANNKVIATKTQLERIKTSRGTLVHQTCQRLRNQLIQIAFVLQDQAISIQNEQKAQIQLLQQKLYQKYLKLIQEEDMKQQQKNKKIQQKINQVKNKWKQLKQNYQIQQLQKSVQSQQYLNPILRKQLYKKIIFIQEQNHNRKKKCLQSLVRNQHVDSLRKVNIDKWYEVLKSINESFDRKLDNLVKNLLDQYNQSKQKHQALISNFQNRLRYIQNHDQQSINQMLTQKYRPIVDNNVRNAQETIKKVTNYVQNNQQKENLLFQNLYKFFLSICQKNDDFVKDFASLTQKYQLQKAKILDDDQQNVETLQASLQSYKRQLKQSLHHIKLEQVEKKCFQKIDQIELAYRKTHEKNKQLSSTRPNSLKTFMKSFQGKMAQIFQLYDQSKRTQLNERLKQQAQKQALRRIQQEDKKKADQQAKQLEQIIKKGGKPPAAAKPKDPKKLASQLQQRKKAMLVEIGDKKIQQLQTSSGCWLVYKALEEICRQFYKVQISLDNKQKQESLKEIQTNNIENVKAIGVDELPDAIVDVQGQKITTNQSILRIKDVAKQLLLLRDNIFKNIDTKNERLLKEANNSDQQMLDDSLLMLDQRLKQHYSLKGELQSQIYVKRSGQITNHKKKYEKYARTIRQKMDTQTERFNFLLQKSLQLLKKHNSDQKSVRQQITTGKNLSELQGMLGKSRQNSNIFANQIKQITYELNRLSTNQIDNLLKRNQQFIKQSKLMKDGGQYSEQQIDWYKQMMAQITDQINNQKTKRLQKTKQIQQQSQKRRKQLLQKFQKQYSNSIQQLSARQGTGKKYGKSKRIAQQKIRFQMNKCQQSQLCITKQIQQIQQIYITQKSHNFINKQKPSTLQWRKRLMTLGTCIDKYAKHLEALKQDLKIKPMIRVNYDETLPDCTMVNGEDDKKLMAQELKSLGPLAEQTEDKPFIKFITDIQKIMSDQARLAYTGDKAKYLTGNDKIPDFLRKYIANMKKSAEDFRQSSIRQLRQSCVKFAQLCQKISEMLFQSIQSYFLHILKQNYSKILTEYSGFSSKNQAQKAQNLRRLRPNLSNPKCQNQLKELNSCQLARQSTFTQYITQLKFSFKSSHFSQGCTYINLLINNYQFLLAYFDSMYLYEDFVKVTGDDIQERTKLDIKQLMIMKQKGINIDSNSQRNIRKKWDGINFTIVNFQDNVYPYKKAQIEETNQKDVKKGAKKDSKKSDQPVAVQSKTNSRMIQTFKTWRQKCVYTHRQQCLQAYRRQYMQIIETMTLQLQNSVKQNQMFNKKWTNIAKQLFLN